MKKFVSITLLTFFLFVFYHGNVTAQLGKRFPPEKKIIKDPITGTVLSFLTTSSAGDSKIYPTHTQWTSDGKWLVFRSGRVRNEALAVNEETGDIIQVTEGGYTGMLCIARKSMKLYYMRSASRDSSRRRGAAIQVMEADLEKIFADSEKGTMRSNDHYQRICGTIPAGTADAGDMALDADEQFVYFRVSRTEAAKHVSPQMKIEENFGPRKMGAGPSGLMSMDINSGKLNYVISVPFQVGHVQTNPWVPGEIIFCWETGGKSPQRTWTVMADGSGLRPLYPESTHEWVTHEAIITKDEVAFSIMGHRKVGIGGGINSDNSKPFVTDPLNPGQEPGWGNSGSRAKPTGLGIVNLRTGEMLIAGQTKSGSGLWHVHGSADGRWAVGDDFSRNIYLIDRKTNEMILLSSGHKQTAADHPHPTFSADGKKIQIQSAMLSADNKAMNICIIYIPTELLNKKY